MEVATRRSGAVRVVDGGSDVVDGPSAARVALAGKEREPAVTPGGAVVTVEDQIEAVLEAIRPALHMDGGDVELVGFRPGDGIVEIRWLGACVSCPISMQTLKLGIERRLVESVPEVTEVLAV